MRKYHISFKDSPDDYFSKGVTIEALSSLSALTMFWQKHPGVVFIYLIDIDSIALVSHQIEFDKKFKDS